MDGGQAHPPAAGRHATAQAAATEAAAAMRQGRAPWAQQPLHSSWGTSSDAAAAASPQPAAGAAPARGTQLQAAGRQNSLPGDPPRDPHELGAERNLDQPEGLFVHDLASPGRLDEAQARCRARPSRTFWARS